MRQLRRHRGEIPEPPRDRPAMRADRLTLRLPGAVRPTLHEVDLEVRFGEVLALVGPNGAGKSTLLAALAGTAHPDAGAVGLAGQPLPTWSPTMQARLRAVLPQSHTAGFGFTCEEVVRMGRSPWQHTPRRRDDDVAVRDALAECDVSRMADRRFAALSGGERARVALARVLAQRTPILLLDEPTAALDLKHQEDVMAIVRARAGAGCAVVLVIHDLNLAAAFADRVTILADGVVRAGGTVADTLTAPILSEVFGLAIDVTAIGGQVGIAPRRRRPPAENSPAG
ncbi:heme ABC transporter ATP-binding protein [Skermania piniformis]|uniref:Heme ABC transporter ATP-binding protein n=1 Tax=Skermania pinensis TaxID=39122 RepID=A0ABX8SAY4_9ACTN|nr:heme ABC transporter ATP-binding protein [Skermania piniformis]QXQ15023.1 heme ABC transporter ATP-binding protein [Skermania piniformis]